jgi:sterol desaturase/sphingolipid hydroxylase (fatty acid hydroxylase superfamily)
VVRDFIQWNVHRLLHRSEFLWRFHKVHHSVRQMGFAAHLRFHWGETIVYRTLEYIPLAMIGFGIQDFFLVHIFATAIGHFNHSNFRLPLGPLRFIFNNPQMHIWHHAKHLPRRYGANYGISLSLWDYLFGTDYLPDDGRDIELGFEEVEYYPTSFLDQQWHPFREKAPDPVEEKAKEPA